MFQKVLVCTDFTDGLQRLVHFVPHLAASGIRQITFLHVLTLDSDRQIPRPDPEKERQARDRLAAAQQEVPDGIKIEIEVQWGRPVEVILNVAKSSQADLIVLGTPMRGLLAEKLFGSTMVNICQRATIPVMIFRPQLLSTYMNGELALRCENLFRYFLLPYDGSTNAEYLVDQVQQRVQAGGSVLKQCLLLWIVDEGGRRDLPKNDHQIEAAKPRLESAKIALAASGIGVETLILKGEPIPEILLAAIDYDISAIAISSERLGRLSALPSPSFAGELLRRIAHPILYFPHPR